LKAKVFIETGLSFQPTTQHHISEGTIFLYLTLLHYIILLMSQNISDTKFSVVAWFLDRVSNC